MLILLGLALNYQTIASYLAGASELPPQPPSPTAPPTATAVPPPTLPPEDAAPSEYDAPPLPEAIPPTPLPTPVWQGQEPVRLTIPALDLDAPIVPIGWNMIEVGDELQAMWDVPNWRAAGWHETSASLGVPGNTVLNGHNTSRGEVFRYLYRLEAGAIITVEAEDGTLYTYELAEKLILPEAGQPLEVRLDNASYTLPTDDERLTLVTCHPYASLANRLILIAYPVNAHAE